MKSINQANFNKMKIDLKVTTFKININYSKICVIVPTDIKDSCILL